MDPGFDGIVGNPPFLGGSRISSIGGQSYLDWVKKVHEESHGNADLVAHFFRQAFNLLRPSASFGLIATNTIGQGDTRATGLRWICTHGGTIYAARKRFRWPGQAAVVVSVVWIIKGRIGGELDLDGNAVKVITAYLFHAGGHENPRVLKSNGGRTSLGVKTYGQGFVFDDADPAANPLAEIDSLTTSNPRNAERIFPYIGGEEVNDHPEHKHSRYVISFEDFPLQRSHVGSSWSGATGDQEEAWLRTGIVPHDYPKPVAADWPDLLRIVEQKVKPERQLNNRESYRRYWWQFAEKRPEQAASLAGLKRTIVVARVGQHVSFTFVSPRSVFSEQLVVCALEAASTFCCLQSRPHEIWARFSSSSMKDDLRYTTTDCFETFPFPAGFETNAVLEAAGREYYEFRAALMQDLWLGLTEIYNLFHAPDDEALARLEALYRKRAATPDWRTAEAVPADRSPLSLYTTPAAALAAVRRLRELHAAMDAAVLTVYGWTDLLPKCTCEFLLDYEDEEDDAAETTGRRKKKPWRYRWPDETRDEVLARLLKLNAERAEEERLAGLAAGAAKPKTKLTAGVKRFRKPKSAGIAPIQPEQLPPVQGDLFE